MLNDRTVELLSCCTSAANALSLEIVCWILWSNIVVDGLDFCRNRLRIPQELSYGAHEFLVLLFIFLYLMFTSSIMCSRWKYVAPKYGCRKTLLISKIRVLDNNKKWRIYTTIHSVWSDDFHELYNSLHHRSLSFIPSKDNYWKGNHEVTFI